MAVEPERVETGSAYPAHPNLSFPLRKGKIQRPLLPEDTVRRDRLLDWMAAKMRCRIIYIIADAGFGKTTLVADFSRRSRIRTFWYRLDEDDTDGLAMIRYIIASCRNVDVGLFRQTESLLNEPSIAGITLESVLPTFMTEFERLGDVPSMFVLDDYYLAEHVASIRSTLEALIDRAPANLSFVFTTRRTPPLAVATLRARSELAEIGKEELRFAQSETNLLFAACRAQSVELDVLEDVQRRTDGWPASLQLVKTAIEGRSSAQVRAFVQSLSGAAGYLYDYLAEEVVGELDADLRNFLPRTAILDDVEPESAAVVADVTPENARELIAGAERVGLLSRADGSGGWRSHPLVRDFLIAHLEAEIGSDGLLELHRRAALLYEATSWRTAIRHWSAAGESYDVRRVLSAAVPTIVATGDLGAAEAVMREHPDAGNPWYDVLRTRVLLAAGRVSLARGALAPSLAHLETQPEADSSLKHAIALCDLALAMEEGEDHAFQRSFATLIASGDEELALIAECSQALLDSSQEGNLGSVMELLRRTIMASARNGHRRFESIGLLNLSHGLRLVGDPQGSLEAGRRAVELLQDSGPSVDLSGARMNYANALGDLGQWCEAEAQIREVMKSRSTTAGDALLDAAILCAQYASPEEAQRLWEVGRESTGISGRAFVGYASAWVDLVNGRVEEARITLRAQPVRSMTMAVGIRCQTLQVQLEIICNIDKPSLESHLQQALALAARQEAWSCWRSLRLCQAALAGSRTLSELVVEFSEHSPYQLSLNANVLVSSLGTINDGAFEAVRREAELRPPRWRPLLRRVVDNPSDQAGARRAADLLESIGVGEDVPRLRALSRRRQYALPNAGKALIRRLAPRAYVEDLGKVSLWIGDRKVPSQEIRRKVLCLLGYLLTRPQLSATREQIIDALWPATDPGSAANSLNQTSYFLRKILDDGCEDDASPGYLTSRGDSISLDPELVTSRSLRCQEILNQLRKTATPELILELARSYTGRFGMDFLYEDWSSCYRENLHAAYLDRMERWIRDDMRIGCFDRAIVLAQHVLMADAEADQIEVLLIRLYLRTGARMAATEQYNHYASVSREQLGVEPPPLEQLGSEQWP